MDQMVIEVMYNEEEEEEGSHKFRDGGGLFVAHKIAKNIIQDQYLALDNSHVYQSCPDLAFTLRQIFILVDCITHAFCSHLSLAKRSCSARATPATPALVAEHKRGVAGLV